MFGAAPALSLPEWVVSGHPITLGVHFTVTQWGECLKSLMNRDRLIAARCIYYSGVGHACTSMGHERCELGHRAGVHPHLINLTPSCQFGLS